MKSYITRQGRALSSCDIRRSSKTFPLTFAMKINLKYKDVLYYKKLHDFLPMFFASPKSRALSRSRKRKMEMIYN